MQSGKEIDIRASWKDLLSNKWREVFKTVVVKRKWRKEVCFDFFFVSKKNTYTNAVLIESEVAMCDIHDSEENL